MNRNVLILLAGVLAGCGGSQAAAPAPAEDGVVAELEPEPEPEPLPACPFDMEQIRNAAVGFNVAIQGEPESWLRLRLVPSFPDHDLSFEYEQRDEGGREVGFEHYVCTPAGLALSSTESDGLTISFSPPVLVLPVDGGSGQSAGSVTLDSADSKVAASYVHTFEASAAPPHEFEGETIQVVSTIRFEGAVESRIETATVWVVAPDLLAPVTRAQSRDDGPVRVESVRTLTR